MEKFAKVETEYGAVKGVRKSTVLGVEYYSFQGIPYMKAPVGKLRFRDAEPPENWTEFDATGECSSYVSKHMLTNEPMGQEDAATINVFTKDVQPSKLYPVMVWVKHKHIKINYTDVNFEKSILIKIDSWRWIFHRVKFH